MRRRFLPLLCIVAAVAQEASADLTYEESRRIGPPAHGFSVAPPPPAGVTPQAPPGGTAVEGINFDENGTNNSGSLSIPPDPIGAVGPEELLSIVNTSIECHLKSDGSQVFSKRIGRDATGVAGGFFEPLGPVNLLFDPKVIYDQYAGRFLAVALEQRDTADGDAVNSSRILLAVSKTDSCDPDGDGNTNEDWWFHAIDSQMNIGGTDHWADYPGFAVDEEAVYITNNMFPFGGGAGAGPRLWIVHKGLAGGFYAGGPATVTVHDPVVSPCFPVTTQPAHVFGSHTDPTAGIPNPTGTFLVQYAGISDGTNEFLCVIRVDAPIGAVAFTGQLVPVGDIDNTAVGMPDAPQCRTGITIETNDRRALNAVWRDDSLWASSQVVPRSGADAGQATAHWWEVDTSNLAALALVQQSDVGAEDLGNGTYTYFPSIVVDGHDNVGIGFSASNGSLCAGAYYTGRMRNQPAGQIQSTGTLASGQDCYERTFGGSRNRWGDYSGIAVDPADDATLCAFNEYALVGAGGPGACSEDGRWGTRWTCFTHKEEDDFASTRALIGLQTPMGEDTLIMWGPSKVVVDVNDQNIDGLHAPGTLNLQDDDGDGLEEVRSKMVLLELHGSSPALGPVTLRLRSPLKSPFKNTIGLIEETVNNTPGVLDVPPFTAGGTADSFFDVYFEVEVGGQVFHNQTALPMEEEITHKPPEERNAYKKPEDGLPLPLFDENNDPTGVSLVQANHAPVALLHDIDADGDVDRDDVAVVVQARRQEALPGDPRDVDGSGIINARDARLVAVNCDLPRCQVVE